jgi:hypothetical protein
MGKGNIVISEQDGIFRVKYAMQSVMFDIKDLTGISAEVSKINPAIAMDIKFLGQGTELGRIPINKAKAMNGLSQLKKFFNI